MKGLKDLAKMEALFFSGEYFFTTSSVSVKAGIAKSKKTGGRPFLLSTDRGVRQQVADLYNKGSTPRTSPQDSTVTTIKCTESLTIQRISDTMKSMMDELEAFLFAVQGNRNMLERILINAGCFVIGFTIGVGFYEH